MTNAFYEIEIDPETSLPIRIKVTALTGRKGKTRRKGRRSGGGQHAAFHFEYKLSEFGKVAAPKMPRSAQKVLAKLK